jgi:hypothetical protein
MNTTFRIVKQAEYDRYLFLHMLGNHIWGMNFHYDSSSEPMPSYFEPDKLLSEIYLSLSDIEDEEKRLNASIEVFNIKREFNKPIEVVEPEPAKGSTIKIPQSQIQLVRNAISFYIQSLDTLRPVLTEDEEYTCFDLRQLDGMLQYEVSVKFTEDESNGFTSRHGVDLPEYIY